MASLPLFIHSPVSESVMQALPFIEESGVFSFHTLRIDADLFALLLDARPCVAIFSIPGPEQTRAVCSLLEAFRLYRTALGYSQRDPTLRIVLVAEQRAVAIERWHELGVHEFIIAPILPRALAFKVSRHYQRAVVSHIPEPVTEVEEEVIVVRGGTGDDLKPLSSYRIANTPFRPVIEDQAQTRFQSTGGKAAKKISVVASIPELKEEEGEWLPSKPSSPARPEEGPGETWNWSWFPPKDRQMKSRWTHHGDRPTYDKKQAGWNLSGEKPELTLKDENGVMKKLLSVAESKEGPEVIVDELLDVQEVSGFTEPSKTPELPESKDRVRKALDPSDSNSSPAKPRRPDSPEQDRNGPTVEKNKNALSVGSNKKKPLPTDSEQKAEMPEVPQKENEPRSEDSPRNYGTRRFGAQEPEKREKKEGPDSTNERAPHAERPDSQLGAEEDQLAEKEPRPADLLDPKERQMLGSRIKRIVLKEHTNEPESEPRDAAEAAQESALLSRLDAALSKESEPESDSQFGLADKPWQSEGSDPSFKFSKASDKKRGPTDRTGEGAAPDEASDSGSLRPDSPLSTKPLSLFSVGEEQKYPSTERELRLDPERPAADMKVSPGSGNAEASADMRVKTGTDEANTWSMQNLDETENFSHKKLDEETEGVLTPRIQESANPAGSSVSNAKTPQTMDPSERARLLKKVYEDLRIETEQKPKSQEDQGFFLKFLKKMRSYLKLGAD